MRPTNEVPPPGIAAPVARKGNYCPSCAAFGRGDRRGRKVALFLGRVRCRKHLALALARSWRQFRRQQGLSPTGRLPDDVIDDAIFVACKFWDAQMAGQSSFQSPTMVAG